MHGSSVRDGSKADTKKRDERDTRKDRRSRLPWDDPILRGILVETDEAGVVHYEEADELAPAGNS